jgi:3-deoxy-7-phosphoheptulonate synthase
MSLAFRPAVAAAPLPEPYPFAGRDGHPEDSVVDVSGVPVGGRRFTVIAGPCAVESRAQFAAAAGIVQRAGAHLLRGGAFKPRTSPYTFQGHGRDALDVLRAVSAVSGLPVISEILDSGELERMMPCVDAFQVGARNMHNTALLKVLGRQPKPVLLKRGPAATVDELLLSAEFLAAGGNEQVILCERGIRTFETATRNTLDLNGVAWLKARSHLPVIVDPSHGTGRRELVIPLARAAAAVGADGLMVEVHPDPDTALSDGAQSLTPAGFVRLMAEIAPFVQAAGRTL